MKWRLLTLMALGLSYLFSGCVTSESKKMPVAYFAFKGSDPNHTFIFKLTDAAKIQHARNILNGAEKQKVHVSGKIVTKKASYNPAWSYHLDPATIGFFQVAME